MGTFYIEEYASVGSAANRDAPVQDGNTFLKQNKDATTSTSAETVTVNANTRTVTFYSLVGNHRVSVGSDTTGDGENYIFVPAGVFRDYGVDPETILYYRLDA